MLSVNIQDSLCKSRLQFATCLCLIAFVFEQDGGSNADATELQKLLEARGPLLKHAVTPKVSANAVAPDDESMSELARVLYKASTMALQ